MFALSTLSSRLAARRLILVGLFLPLLAHSAHSKEIWLSCGGQSVALDSDIKTFSLQSGETVVQGVAIFYPTQINFESVGNTGQKFNSKFRNKWAIDRRTLSYTRELSYGHEIFRGVVTWSAEPALSGKCTKAEAPKNLI